MIASRAQSYWLPAANERDSQVDQPSEYRLMLTYRVIPEKKLPDGLKGMPLPPQESGAVDVLTSTGQGSIKCESLSEIGSDVPRLRQIRTIVLLRKSTAGREPRMFPHYRNTAFPQLSTTCPSRDAFTPYV